jgi:hypothetical protein
MLDISHRESALYYENIARRAVTSGNYRGARMAFVMSIRSWERTVESHPTYQSNLDDVRKEYVRFVRKDRTHAEILDEVRKAIARQPGITQTELFHALAHHPPSDVNAVLYFGIKKGDIARKRVNNDLALSLTSPSRTVSVKGVLKLIRSIIPARA